MIWGKYLGFFGFSTVKFLFTPFGGPAAGLTFLETYLSCIAGALFGSALFFFLSEFFLNKAHENRQKALQKAIEQGIEVKLKKKFTKSNKFIVKLKQRIGIVGICFFAPLILSIPIGSIISAKFYGKETMAYPLIALGIVLNGLLTTGLAYAVASLF